MTERWTCARCSAENEPWLVGCSSCGTVRQDLSVAGSQPDPQPPPPPTPPEPQAAAEPEAEAIDPPQPSPTDSADADAPAPVPASPPAPAWAPGPASAVPPDELAAISQTAAGLEEAPPVAREPFWKRLPLGLIVFGFFILAGAIGGLIFNASRGSEGEITKSGDLAAEELRVGDCFDLKDPSAEELDDVTALPCSSEHEYETFHVGAMAEGPFPTEDAFIDWIDVNCVPAFSTYVGLAYEESELEITWLQPTSEAWSDGDRSMQCVLYHPRIHRLTESMKDSAQ